MIRDEHGGFISMVALPLGTQKIHVVEVVTTYNNLNLAYSLGFCMICIEGDSLNIINYLNI